MIDQFLYHFLILHLILVVAVSFPCVSAKKTTITTASTLAMSQFTASSDGTTSDIFGATTPYEPPTWLVQPGGVVDDQIPKAKVQLGRFPTPLHHVALPGFEDLSVDTWVKRDDMTSFDLSGNKVRKLEFLLADALAKKHDCVITIGGIQSNHARATAVAARQLGLQPHLILRRPSGTLDQPITLTGNLLLDRMVDAKIHTVSTGTYMQIGSYKLCEQLAEQLREEGMNPYIIPVGGSNSLGALGYTECVREIIGHGVDFDHIVFGCGSGGTAAGLAIGCKLAGLKAQVHGIGVCDTPEEFYQHIEEVASELGIDANVFGSVRSWLHIYAGQGIGYAKSTTEELKYLIEVGRRTGIVFDPVYSGKALYHFTQKVIKEKKDLMKAGDKVLFIHTGGTLGLFDKEAEILALLPSDQVQKMKFPIN